MQLECISAPVTSCWVRKQIRARHGFDEVVALFAEGKWEEEVSQWSPGLAGAGKARWNTPPHADLKGVNENESFAFQGGSCDHGKVFYFYQDKLEKADYNTCR